MNLYSVVWWRNSHDTDTHHIAGVCFTADPHRAIYAMWAGTPEIPLNHGGFWTVRALDDLPPPIF